MGSSSDMLRNSKPSQNPSSSFKPNRKMKKQQPQSKDSDAKVEKTCSPNLVMGTVRISNRKMKKQQPRSKDSDAKVEKTSSPNLVMGTVRILKRGEKLDSSSPSKDDNVQLDDNQRCHHAVPEGSSSFTNNDRSIDPVVFHDDLVLCTTSRLGPDPDLVPKQVVPKKVWPAEAEPIGSLYAGSAFASCSPSPRSLPFPSFFFKKDSLRSKGVDDLATSTLRRLLCLDLL